MALAGGYRLKFVELPPEWLVCSLCKLTARDPQLSNCCHYNFCRSCLQRAQPNTGRVFCPVCSDYEFAVTANKRAENEIQTLCVFCPNKDKGCQWKGRVEEVVEHVISKDGCQMELVACYNNCGKQLERGKVADHMITACPGQKFTVKCQYCTLIGTKHFIMGEHVTTCPKQPLKCPNNCSDDWFERTVLSTHLEHCSWQIVMCEYHDIGCTKQCRRSEMADHLEMNAAEHLMLVKDQLCSTRKQVQEVKSTAQHTNEHINASHSSFDKTIDQLVTMVQSLATCHGNRESACWLVSLGCQAMVSASNKSEVPVILQMLGYMDKMAYKTIWFSPSFWSQSCGFELQLKVCVWGASPYEGTHLSLGINVVGGGHSNQLPFSGAVVVELLNQLKDSGHYKETIVFDNQTPQHIASSANSIAWGRKDFLSNDKLSMAGNCCYLKDDCLFFRVSMAS